MKLFGSPCHVAGFNDGYKILELPQVHRFCSQTLTAMGAYDGSLENGQYSLRGGALEYRRIL
jgi:hypothetical protein